MNLNTATPAERRAFADRMFDALRAQDAHREGRDCGELECSACRARFRTRAELPAAIVVQRSR